MQIYVCVKHVPDTAANIKVTGANGFDDEACKFIVNPYDEYALEEAVRLSEKNANAEIVAVSVGKPAAEKTLRSALAMGAHRGILVKTDQQFLDSTTTAQALKAAIAADGSPDIIFTGKTSVDTEGFQTLYRLAAALDLPVASEVVDFKLEADRAVVEHEIGGGTREVLALTLPCVIGATKGLNEPRYPKFPDIMKAKKKEIKQLNIEDLQSGGVDQLSELVTLEPVAERTGARMIEGDIRAKVAELVRILKHEEKVI